MLCCYTQAYFSSLLAVSQPQRRVSVGIGGGAGPNHALQANGTAIGEIYNVSRPVGQRWSTVADSQIWRLNHSVAFLTSNAEV